MRYLIIALVAVFMTLGLDALLPTTPAEASRPEDCSCRELRAIRQMLESQFQLQCDGRRCLPIPTPTVPNGGELP